MSKNMREKSINSEVLLYGVKATGFDPATGTLSPTGWLGFGDAWYHSCPVARGQSYKVTRRTKSWWTGEFNHEVIIEVGYAPQHGGIQVKGGTWHWVPAAEFIPEPPKPPVKFPKNE